MLLKTSHLKNNLERHILHKTADPKNGILVNFLVKYEKCYSETINKFLFWKKL